VSKTFAGLLLPAAALLALACASCREPAPELYPVVQGQKVGYMNREGRVVIQPQFKVSFLFSEGLAAACLEHDDRCGYINAEGKFVIPPQFKGAMRFSGGLAAVMVVDKVGYVDKTGKLVIAPQFGGGNNPAFMLATFSEGRARVKVGDRYGFIDETGAAVINPRFEDAQPFFEGLAAAAVDKKFGFIDKTGKFVIQPQYDDAGPFSDGLAAVKVGEKFGYTDKTGRLVIVPQFDAAFPFSKEGLALVFRDKKVGLINKGGVQEIATLFDPPALPIPWEAVFLFTPEVGRASFSEGLTGVTNGDGKAAYIDRSGKFVINTQSEVGLPFFHGLAMVATSKTSTPGATELAWVDKAGQSVWREVVKNPSDNANTNTAAADTNSNANVSTNANVAANFNAANVNTANVNTSNVNTSGNMNSAPAARGRTGRLITDANLRSAPNKDSASVGIHFRGATVQILDESRYERDGEVVTWYKVKILRYGRSVDANLTGGKNNPSDADQGWVNAKLVSPD
jgi:hypothetical protein